MRPPTAFALLALTAATVAAAAAGGQCSGPPKDPLAGGTAPTDGGPRPVALDAAGLAAALRGDGVTVVLFEGKKKSATAAFLADAWPAAADALKGVARFATVSDAAAAKQHGVPSPPAVVAFAPAKRGPPTPSTPLSIARGAAATTAADVVGLALDAARAGAEARLGESVGPASATCECGGGAGRGGSASARASGGASARASASSGGTNKKKTAPSSPPSSDRYAEPGGFYQAASSAVHSLGDATLAAFVKGGGGLVEFYAPWCGHCQSLKPAFSAAAKRLREAGSTGRLGAVDCTVHQAACSRHSVQGYPTLLFFDAGSTRGEPYAGPRDADAIAAFLVDAASLAAACTAADPPARLCVFAFLPPLPDTTAKDRAAAVDALTTAAGGFAGRPFGWAWAAGGDLADLEAALGVGGYGFPAVVAVVPGDAPRVAHMKGGYGAAEIKRFVERARGGGAAAAPVSSALATAATVAPWDGKDAPAGAAVEDEFSLDDIMNEL